MPQPAQPSPSEVAAGTAAAGATAAGAKASLAAPAAAGAGSVALGVATAGILGAFVSFLAALREQHRAWLVGQLGKYTTQPEAISQTVSREMGLEQEFAKNAANRLATGLPPALRIKEPKAREARVRQILSDEERYAAQRAEAMVARAIAAVTRFDLRQSSPLGAFWKLGAAEKHTAGCLFMHGKFWPWAVLDRVHPPRHYGCTSQLLGYGEAILAGLMSPSDVPDTRDAIRAASGVVMEAEEVSALLDELALREMLEQRGVDTSGIPFVGLLKEDWHGTGQGLRVPE